MMDEDTRRAVEPAMERIRRDRELLPEKYRQILEELERGLFDPQLDVQQLFVRAEVRDRSAATEIKRLLGDTLRQYIEDRRLETAARLVMTTERSLAGVAAFLGYSSAAVFSRAFKRWAGVPAQRFRMKAGYDRSAERDVGPDDLLLLRDALAGSARPELAEKLVRKLAARYPRVRRILDPEPTSGDEPSGRDGLTGTRSDRPGERTPPPDFRAMSLFAPA